MATNQNQSNGNQDSQDSSEPDFSKDSTLEFHNKQNLKDLNSEAHSSKSENSTDDEADETTEYRSHSVSKTSVRDRIPHTNTDNTPE